MPIVIRIVDIFVETLPFIFASCYEKETLNKCLFQEFLNILKNGLRFIKKERKYSLLY